VKLEVEGQPVPNFVFQAQLPGSGMLIDSAFIRNYQVPEGKEFLDTYEYLNTTKKEEIKVSPDHLKSLVVSVHIFNPRKQKYRMWIHECDTSKGDKIGKRNDKLVYAGSLSRKEFNFFLPTQKGVERSFYFELRSPTNELLYRGLDICYAVGAK
jgi:hypothetical protein